MRKISSTTESTTDLLRLAMVDFNGALLKFVIQNNLCIQCILLLDYKFIYRQNTIQIQQIQNC